MHAAIAVPPLALAKDADARRDEFAELYLFGAERLRTVAAILLGSRSEAEDVVHDALIDLLERRVPTHPAAKYLERTVRRTCRDRLRARRVESDLACARDIE